MNKNQNLFMKHHKSHLSDRIGESTTEIYSIEV